MVVMMLVGVTVVMDSDSAVGDDGVGSACDGGYIIMRKMEAWQVKGMADCVTT